MHPLLEQVAQSPRVLEAAPRAHVVASSRGVVWRGSRAGRARGSGRRGTVGARVFVCTPVRSPPPGAWWCLAHLPGVEFFVWGGVRPAEAALPL